MRIFAAAFRTASHLSRSLALAALALASALASAAPGTLVSKTLTQIPGNDTKSYAIAVQPDGKILTAGYAYLGTKQFAITRYNADGTIDTSFADAGTRLEPLGATNSEAHAIGVQSTGKIVVGGFAVGSASQFGIARFNTDGSLDTSFGGGGALTSVGSDSGALAMAIQQNDKIVLAGWSTVGGKKVFALARYEASSPTLDTTFGSGGVVIGSADALDEQINGVALQSDGKIVAVGSYGSGNSNETTVRRYNADGSLDTSFGTSGTQFLTLMQDGHAVAVLANGSILVAGEYGGAFTVARLTSAGTLDTTFGVNGYAQAGDGSSSGLGKAMQVQQDGKIVVAGTGGNGSASAIAIARFNADGSNDTGFGNSGSTITQFSIENDEGNALAIFSSGELVVAGGANPDPADCACTPNTSDDGALLIGFTSSGAHDQVFAGGGRVTSRGSLPAAGYASALQSDGKLIVAGLQHPTPSQTDHVIDSITEGTVVRYNTDGSLDTTFGTRGIATTAADRLLAAAVQSDGKIVVAGYQSCNYQGTDSHCFEATRLNANGTPDASFGTTGTVMIATDSPANEQPNAIALQSDGKIVLAGIGGNQGGFSDSEFVRLNGDGSIDTTFGGTGKVRVAMSTGNDQINALAIQSDGKILGSGWGQVSGSQDSIMTARLNSDGSLDSAFGTAGIAITTVGTTSAHGNAMVLQPDGKIVVGGQWFSPTSTTDDFVVARYNADGSTDTSFGTNGVTTTDMGNHNRIHALVLMPSGKIVAAGEWGGAFGLAQYLATGALDTSFGSGGSVFLPMNAGSDIAYSMVLRLDDNLWVSGDASSVIGTAIIEGDSASSPPPATATVSLASSANPSTTGQSVTFTSTVTGGSGTPTGTVTFNDGGSAISGCSAVALSAGSATCSTSALSQGGHSITAQYSGNGTYAPATSTPLTQTVNAPAPASATVSLGSSANPSTSGQSVTFTATVTGSSGTPTGTVSFLDGSTSICSTVALSSGAATCATSSLAVGTHSITASYSGDGTYGAASSSAVNQVVQSSSGGGTSANVAAAAAGATATASSSASTRYPVAAIINGDRTGAGFGNGGIWEDATPGSFPDWVQINFNGSQTIDHVIVYSMQDNYSSPVEPTDTMTFRSYGVTAFDVQAWNGSAWVTVGSVTGNNLVKRTVSFAQVTTDRIRIVIKGAALNGYSRLAEVEAWSVGGSGGGTTPVNATIALSSSLNPSTEGQSVTFNANVSGSAGTATGTVSFMDGGGAISGCSAVTLSGGSASCATSALAQGTHSITASYSGDASYNAGTSAAVAQTVNAASSGLANPTVAVSSSANPSTFGDSVTFTANVSGSAGTPSGTVSFMDGSSAICSSVTLSSGSATCMTSSLAAGSHSISVSYSGDGSYNPGTSAALTQTVQSSSGGGTSANVAAAAAGATATASSSASTRYPVAAIINGDRTGAGFGNGGIWEDATPGSFPDWVQIQFNGSQTIDHVIVYSMQDNYSSPVEPTDTMTFRSYGVTAFDVQAWNGSAWVTVGSVTGNNLVKRTVSFAQVTTDRIRIVIKGAALNGYSRLAEVEAWSVGGSGGGTTGAGSASIALASSANPSTEGQSVTFTATLTGGSGTPTGSVDFLDGGTAVCANVALSGGVATCATSALAAGTHSITVSYSGDANYIAGTSSALSQVVQSAGGGSDVNVAAASAGATATASSTLSSRYPVSAIINGDRTGAGFGNGGIWEDANAYTFPDWVQIDFAAAKTLDHVIVYSMQDAYSSPVEPTDTMTFRAYGVVDFLVQGWDGSQWVTLGAVTDNDLVKRTVSFPAFTTDRIRVVITNANNGYSRLAEVEAFGH